MGDTYDTEDALGMAMVWAPLIPVVVPHHDINGFQAIADRIEEKPKQVISGDAVRRQHS